MPQLDLSISFSLYFSLFLSFFFCYFFFLKYLFFPLTELIKVSKRYFLYQLEFLTFLQREEIFLKKIYFYLINRIVVQIQALSKEEVFFYSEAFGIPTNKFVVIPFSTTLIGYNFLQKNRNFLLSGGSSYRDYETLIDAAKKFPIPLEIGLPKGSNLISKESIGKDSNIIVHSGLTRAEFIEKTSECTLFLLSVSPDLKRSVGDQSILNAMYYGKIVIATDSIGPRNYIKNGVNGFLVPESNADAWVNVVNHVLNLDVNDYKRITSNAIYTDQVIFSEKNRIKRVLMAASIFL